MKSSLFRCATAVAALVAIASCGGAPPADVAAAYDAQTGKLRQITLNGQKDGKPNIFSYMEGTKFIRIEIDQDEDGQIDRWEYYGPDQQLEKVGLSRARDGKVDAWAFSNRDGSIARVEVSTRRDGHANRTEFYDRGALSRVEEDTNGDGRADKWETYVGGVLASASFDTKNAGIPTVTIDYLSESAKPSPR
jgi:predicted small lipoprotein YifL